MSVGIGELHFKVTDFIGLVKIEWHSPNEDDNIHPFIVKKLYYLCTVYCDKPSKLGLGKNLRKYNDG